MKITNAMQWSLSNTLEAIQYFPINFRPGNLDNFLIDSGLPFIKVNNKFFVESQNGFLYRIRRDNRLSVKQKSLATVMPEIHYEIKFIFSIRKNDKDEFEKTLRNMLEVTPERGTEVALIYLQETHHKFNANIFKPILSHTMQYEFMLEFGNSDVYFFLNDSQYRLSELPFVYKRDAIHYLEKTVTKVYTQCLDLFVLNVL